MVVISIAPELVKYSGYILLLVFFTIYFICCKKETSREEPMGQVKILLIVGICLLALLALAWRRRLEWLLNLLLRGVLGAVAIFFINLAVVSRGYPALVGINPATVLTCSVLGFPGLAALYGLQVLHFL